MNYLFLAVSVLLGTGKNMVSKSVGDNFSGVGNLLKTNIVTALIGISVFGISGMGLEIFKNPVALLLGVLYGIFTMLSQTLFIKAVEYSATAVCSLIYSMGFILPTLFSVAVFGEAFGTVKIIAFALMLVSFFMVSNTNFGGSGKIYYAFFAMFSSGAVGIIQKLTSKLNPAISVSQYLTVAFAVMLVLSVVCLSAVKQKPMKMPKKQNILFLITSAVMGVCVVFANSINLNLASKMPAVIFFTCVNGGTIILSAIFSKLLFKDNIKPVQTVGIALGISAIVLMVV